MAITTIQLQELIDSKIKSNSKREITGAVLNNVLTKLRQFVSEQISDSDNIDVGNTAVTNGGNGRLFFQQSNKINQSPLLWWNFSQARLGIGFNDNAGARLDVRAQGNLSTDKVFRVRNFSDSQDKVVFSGDGTAIWYGDQEGGNYVAIRNKTTYDARIELMAGDSVKTSIWNDISSGQYINRGFNIYHPGIVGSATAKINNILGTGLAAYGAGYGFNWAFTSNPDGYFSQGDRAMWLTSTKSLVLYNGSAGSDIFSEKGDAFQMYSADDSGVAIPHFRCENGDTIKLKKLDWSEVTSVASVISKLQELGL